MPMMELLKRTVILFMLGIIFPAVLNLLQTYREIKDPSANIGVFSHYDSSWWVLPACGVTSVIIGLLYPCIDKHLGEPREYKGEWSTVMRCVAVFVGINHASAKLDFINNFHMSVILAAMSIGLWWLFDRSRSGFGIGVAIAVLATFVTQFLTYYGVYRYTKADFMFVRAWLTCIFFSGCVTMGLIGRQLATCDTAKLKHD